MCIPASVRICVADCHSQYHDATRRAPAAHHAALVPHVNANDGDARIHQCLLRHALEKSAQVV
eukprot:5478775-Pleurochrysis_carterae.AAC.2